jgi:nucleoside-diphosphate-sugar epimerase
MASPHHVLLLGGHGRISQLLTPLLLKRSWTVTSVIRAQDQVPTIEKLGTNLPGKLNVLVRSIEDVNSQDDAASLLKEVQPDYIAWSAGAGGKGGKERTYKVDRDAAIHFIRAAASIPSISRFLLVSYSGSRRAGAPWWPAEEWDEYNQSINHGVLADYYQAKIAADEVLYEASRSSQSLIGIDLRPATLTDKPAGGVKLGKTEHPKAYVSRESVAQVASALLAVDGIKNTWLDLEDGSDAVEAAVATCVDNGVDAAEGEAIFKSKV